MDVAAVYENPQVMDYGSLQDLTGACVFGTGGDQAFPTGSGLGVTFGRSNPAFNCTSD